MNRYCDNYSTCNSVILDWGKNPLSDDRVRAAGWRTWKGLGMTGKPLDVTLCSKCVHSVPLLKTMVMQGQEELFKLEESE